jgi:hypothetical protein
MFQLRLGTSVVDAQTGASRTKSLPSYYAQSEMAGRRCSIYKGYITKVQSRASTDQTPGACLALMVSEIRCVRKLPTLPPAGREVRGEVAMPCFRVLSP